MSEVYVPYGDSASDTAVLLLEAAEKNGGDQTVVRTTEGGFVVPEEIAKAAKVDYESDDEDDKQAEQANDRSVNEQHDPQGSAAKKSGPAAKK